jgi:hypothetical protein
MDTHSKRAASWGERLNLHLDWMLHILSSYALSFFVVCVSIAALLTWERQNSVSAAEPLNLRLVADAKNAMSPAQALNALKTAPGVQYHDTKLSEKPFWFSFTVERAEPGVAMVAHLPSRHALEYICWDASSLSELGRATRYQTWGAMFEAKGLDVAA